MKFDWKLDQAIEKAAREIINLSKVTGKDYTIFLKVFLLPGLIDIPSEKLTDLENVLDRYPNNEEFVGGGVMVYQILYGVMNQTEPAWNDEPLKVFEYTGEMSFTHEFLLDVQEYEVLKRFQHLTLAAERMLQRCLGNALVLKAIEDKKVTA